MTERKSNLASTSDINKVADILFRINNDLSDDTNVPFYERKNLINLMTAMVRKNKPEILLNFLKTQLGGKYPFSDELVLGNGYTMDFIKYKNYYQDILEHYEWTNTVPLKAWNPSGKVEITSPLFPVLAPSDFYACFGMIYVADHLDLREFIKLRDED